MKKLKYLIVFCLFISCKKTTHENTAVTGQWEWVKSTGGIGGIIQTPQSTGLTWQLNLNIDLTASQTGNYMPAGNGNYILREETVNGETRQLLDLSINGQPMEFVYSFTSPDSLRLDNNIAADGLSYLFVRE